MNLLRALTIAAALFVASTAAARAIVTNENLSQKMTDRHDLSPLPTPGKGGNATWKLHIDDSESGRQQTMTGFGAAWTDATVTVFDSLAAADQEVLLKELFTPDDGINLGLMRHTIGCDPSISRHGFAS